MSIVCVCVCVCTTVNIQFDNTSTCKYSSYTSPQLGRYAPLSVRPPPIQKF